MFVDVCVVTVIVIAVVTVIVCVIVIVIVVGRECQVWVVCSQVGAMFWYRANLLVRPSYRNLTPPAVSLLGCFVAVVVCLVGIVV